LRYPPARPEGGISMSSISSTTRLPARSARFVLLGCAMGLLLTLVGSVAGATPASAAVKYTITDLGSLGFGVSRGFAMNANAQATGGSYLSKTIKIANCPYLGQTCSEHPEHAFLASSGSMSNLGTL